MAEINVTDRQRERFDEIKEEIHDAEKQAIPKPTDEELMGGLIDTWDAVGAGHYSKEGVRGDQ